MPFYEYQCSQCKHITEVMQPVGTDQPPMCAKCGGAETRKVLSAPGAPQMASSKRATSPQCGGCSGGACGMQ